MTTTVDLLIHSAAQLVTCASPAGAKRGAAMAELGIVADGAVAITDGKIVAVGTSGELLQQYEGKEELDASGRVVIPGFVDPHTHVVYAGDRAAEFERRVRGESYQQIAAAGGGILSTVKATRAAAVPTLVEQSLVRLTEMLGLGTTTVEVKTGYGLDATTEMKLLRAIDRIDRTGPVELVPTFLAAHAVPPEYAGRADAYVELVIDELLPAARAWHEGSAFAADGRPLFCDVFCEQHAFDLAQSRRVLEAGRHAGLPLKAHVDEFSALGGLALALELGATSVDHLDVTGADGIAALARSSSIAVVIPTVTFNFGSTRFADARGMVDAGAAVALTTDINPGSAPCPSMPLAMAIACRYQKLSPAEALVAATINAAHAIGLGDRVGSLEPGKQADLAVVDAVDYRHLAYQFGGNLVVNVIKKGTIVL
ncbi:MAG TPA: imidazolonepropionase [Verrucomicrobiae bacterium]|nr:imidazolonepropionase [Verrucomicrobiae bacterium]